MILKLVLFGVETRTFLPTLLIFDTETLDPFAETGSCLALKLFDHGGGANSVGIPAVTVLKRRH